MDFQPRPKQIDLLAEPVTDAEVRTLLERLGSREFGGPEDATLGSVVEATGSDAATVGRLLAKIRKEDFEERFGIQLKDHGRRIETLEEKSSRLERERRVERPKTYLRNEPEHDEYRERAINRLAEEERQREQAGPVIAVVSIVSAVILIWAFGGRSVQNTLPSERDWNLDRSPGLVIGSVNAGTMEWGNDGNIIVRVSADGSIRLPTKKEVQKFRIYKSQGKPETID